MTKPRAVLISDLHYSINTLELADAALRQAIVKADELTVPVFICGDTNDTKAILRAEVMNKLLETVLWAADLPETQIVFLVGNHDRINEKSSEHSLTFLDRIGVSVIAKTLNCYGITCMSYYSNPEEFAMDFLLKIQPKDGLVLIHQGVKGGNAGHYIQDHSAVDVELLKAYRTIGGHYHNHHTVGNHTFIGNAYTLNFGEANDHPKGFLVLYDDNSVEHIPTNLRKHIIIERTIGVPTAPGHNYVPGDLVWVKLTGTTLELDKWTRAKVAHVLGIPENFKFDKIPTDQPKARTDPEKPQTEIELMDSLIDQSQEADYQKSALKALYREVLK